MTVTKVRPVPSDLPYARLYLDDLQEISDILSQAYSTPEGQPTVLYGFADIVTDSIQDLRDRGGSALDLRIEVDRNTVWLAPGRPSIMLALPEAERWRVYGRIKEIFEARRLVLKNIFASLPPPLQGSLIAAAMAAFPLIVILTQTHHTASLLLLGGYALVVAPIAWAVARRSRVYFVDSHVRSRLSAETRRGWVRDIGMLIVGLLIGTGGKALLEKLFK